MRDAARCDSRERLAPGTSLGPYTIVQEIGAGGFGITYEAQHADLGRVVVKEYFPTQLARRDAMLNVVARNQLGDVFQLGMDRFLAEARALAALRHDAIARVHNFFRAGKTAYMVLESIEGEPLAERLRQGATLRQEQVDRLVRWLASAVSHAHSHGLLHLDISPDNVMIRPGGRPVLIDFGAARREFSRDTRRSGRPLCVVKPGFSPPEQYRPESVLGPGADVYAFGALVYRCVTGRNPPAAPDREAGAVIISALRGGRGRYRRPMLAAIDRALSLEEERRPESVHALAEAMLFQPRWLRKMASLALGLCVTSTMAFGYLAWERSRSILHEAAAMTRVAADQARKLRQEAEAASAAKRAAEKRAEQAGRIMAEAEAREKAERRRAEKAEADLQRERRSDASPPSTSVVAGFESRAVRPDVGGGFLALRSEPDHRSPELGRLRPGTVVVLLGERSLSDARRSWLKVQHGDQVGWVAERFLTPET